LACSIVTDVLLQVYVIHATLAADVMVPCVYMLLQHTTQEVYEQLLQVIGNQAVSLTVARPNCRDR